MIYVIFLAHVLLYIFQVTETMSKKLSRITLTYYKSQKYFLPNKKFPILINVFQVIGQDIIGYLLKIHDLVYKPLSGNLSNEELSILDELNGLVLAGEIALERLNEAAKSRIKTENAFNNQYELASFLYTKYQNKIDSNKQLKLGNVELLFNLMIRCKLMTASDLAPYLKSLDFAKGLKTISELITDNIIFGNSDRYNIYISLKTSSNEENNEFHASIGQFMEQWILLERLINSISMDKNPNYRTPFSTNNLKIIFSPAELSRIIELRKYRNALVHGALIPEIKNLKQMTNELKTVCDKLQDNYHKDIIHI